MTELETLRAKVDAYNLAADLFIEKVETGQAKSRVTYAMLKAARALPETGKRHKLTPTGDAARGKLISERLKLRRDMV